MTYTSAFDAHVYWRYGRLRWHCYRAITHTSRGRQVFRSLCGEHTMPEGIGGQRLTRPPAIARCAACDTEEMKLLGKDESLPESKNWNSGGAA